MFRPISSERTTPIQSGRTTPLPDSDIFEIDDSIQRRFSTAEQEFLEELKTETVFSKNFFIKEKQNFKEYKSIIGSTICCKSLKIYLFGGKYNEEIKNSFYSYNLLMNEWNKIENEFEPPKLMNHTMELFENSLIVFGGELEKEGNFSNEIYSYNFVNWEKIKIQNDKKPSKRSLHSSIVYKKSMYIFGGICSKNETINSNIFKYFNGEWNELECKGDIPEPRYSHSSIIYEDKMIIYGGKHLKNENITNEMFELNLKTLEWKRVNIFDLPNLSNHSSILFKDEMYIFGGDLFLKSKEKINQQEEEKVNFKIPSNDIKDDDDDDDIINKITNFVERKSILKSNKMMKLNLITKEYKLIKDFGDFILPTSQHSMTIDKDGENIFIFGGINSNNLFKFILQSIQNVSFLYNILKRELYCDIIFNVKNESFKAHKYIVSQSLVFKELIQRGFEKNEEKEFYIEITLTEVNDVKLFEQILEFLYTGIIYFDTIELYFELIKFSKKFKIESLKIYLLSQISNVISTDELLFKSFNLSIDFKIDEIKNYCSLILFKRKNDFLKITNLPFKTKASIQEFTQILKLRQEPSFSWINQNSEVKLYLHISNLFYSKLFSDVSFITKDGIYIKAHLSILCAFSPYFAKMFSNLKLKKGQSVRFKPSVPSLKLKNSVEAFQIESNFVAIFDSGIFEKTEIPLDDFESNIFELILEFIYTQKIETYPSDEQSLIELLKCSKICKVFNLVEIISLKLIKLLTFSNSFKIIEFCDEFDIHNILRNKAWEILNNASKDDLIQTILESQLKHSKEISELTKKVEKSERMSNGYHQIISQSQQQIQQLQRQLKKFILQNNNK
eukprot:gene12614-6519_t